MRKVILAGAAASVVCINAAASATPLLFNMNPNSGTNGAGTATVTDFEAAGLPSSLAAGVSDSQVLYQDSDNTGTAPNGGSPASGITVSGGGFTYNGGSNIPNDPSDPSAKAVYQEVLIANPGSTQNTTVNGLSTSSSYGLSPLTTYELYLFPVSVINNDNLSITFAYDTQQATLTNVPSASPAVFQFTTGVTVNNSLSISETDYNYGGSGSGDRSYPGFASFAIVPLPEPATVCMALFGSAACLFRRRR